MTCFNLFGHDDLAWWPFSLQSLWLTIANKQAWLKEDLIYVFVSSFLLPLLLLFDWHMNQHIQRGHVHMTIRTPFALQTPKDLDWSWVEFSQGTGQFLLSKHGLFMQGVYSAASHKPYCSHLQPQCLTKSSLSLVFAVLFYRYKYFSMSLLHFFILFYSQKQMRKGKNNEGHMIF